MRVRVPFQRLSNEIETPRNAYQGDAGVDLRSSVDLVLAPGERAAIPCGVSLAIPEGYAGFVLPRSGLAAKHGISLVNAPGLIDSGFRGEVRAILINLDPEQPFSISKGDRIAQLLVLPVPVIEFVEVDDIGTTERGSGGFGSSGVS